MERTLEERLAEVEEKIQRIAKEHEENIKNAPEEEREGIEAGARRKVKLLRQTQQQIKRSYEKF